MIKLLLLTCAVWPLARLAIVECALVETASSGRDFGHLVWTRAPTAWFRPGPQRAPLQVVRLGGEPALLTATRPRTGDAPAKGRSEHVRAVYERAAGGYDRYYRRAWIAAAGGRAEQAMLAQVTGVLAPLEHPRVLDAGAGTGALSRELARLRPDVHPVLVDLSPAMLGRAADLGDPRTVASVTALPFPDATFDAVVCAWVIETVDEPHEAVRELLRVLRPGGRLIYSFCSRPRRRGDRWRTWPLRASVHGVFSGHFLNEAQTPFHLCDVSSRTSYAGGAVTVVTLGTCCTVD